MAKRKSKGRGFSLGGGGGKKGLANQLQAMQEQMMQTQEELGEKTVEATAGGGVVKVVMTGHQQLLSITIEPDVVDPEDVEMLQDLILAAVNEAVEQSKELAAGELGEVTGGLNLQGLLGGL